MLAGITEYLSRFADLVYFGMENRYRLTLGPPRTAADRLVVECWGDACPTLEACCLSECADLHCFCGSNHYLQDSVGWVKVSGVWTVAPLERFYELADRVHLAVSITHSIPAFIGTEALQIRTPIGF
jgi:hypothetical protein